MNKKKIISTIIIASALLVLGLLAKQSFEAYQQEKFKLEEKQLLNQAVYECGQISSASWTNNQDNTQVTEPYKPAYEKCLQDKNIFIKKDEK